MPRKTEGLRPLTDAERQARRRQRKTSEMQRLLAIEEHAGMLRDAVESIAAGHAQKAETIRAQCRLLVRAYDEGTQGGIRTSWTGRPSALTQPAALRRRLTPTRETP